MLAENCKGPITCELLVNVKQSCGYAASGEDVGVIVGVDVGVGDGANNEQIVVAE